MNDTTKETNWWIKTYGCESDALNVAVAKIQELSAWIIAQEKCPDCFGDIWDIETVTNNVHTSHYVCYNCVTKWQYFGKKIEDEDE